MRPPPRLRPSSRDHFSRLFVRDHGTDGRVGEVVPSPLRARLSAIAIMSRSNAGSEGKRSALSEVTGDRCQERKKATFPVTCRLEPVPWPNRLVIAFSLPKVLALRPLPARSRRAPPGSPWPRGNRVDRGEAHIGDGVEPLQRLHDQPADRRGLHLVLAHVLELAHDAATPCARRARGRSGASAARSAPSASACRGRTACAGPLRLTTVSSRSCTRSKVVKRPPQSAQTRRRRMVAFSSVGRLVLHLRVRAAAIGAAHERSCRVPLCKLESRRPSRSPTPDLNLTYA